MESQISFKVPSSVRGEFARASRMSAWLIVPALMCEIVTLCSGWFIPGFAEWNSMLQKAFIIMAFVIVGYFATLGYRYSVRYFFQSPARELARLAEVASSDVELPDLIYTRFTTTCLTDLSGRVLDKFQVMDLDIQENRKRDYWIMNLDANFSTVSFLKVLVDS